MLFGARMAILEAAGRAVRGYVHAQCDAEIESLRRKVAILEARNAFLEPRAAQTERCEAELAKSREEKEKLAGELATACEEGKKLQGLLEAARRAGKRQASPFGKGPPKQDPKKPGRKPGKKYGKRGARPRPKKIDEVCEANLPETCPDASCGGHVKETAVDVQFVTDVPPPPKPHTIQFNVHIGECCTCGRRVQGRHEKQHSDALGAANNQIGPYAVAFAATLNKELGVTYAKMARFYETAWGLKLSRSTLARGLLRLGEKAEPIFEKIKLLVRSSKLVVPDETGYKVGGRPYYLWAFPTPTETLYVIRQGRGHEIAFEVLGEHFDQWLVHDGFIAYDCFKSAKHGQCNNHLLNRANEAIEVGTPEKHAFAIEFKALIGRALDLRDLRDAGDVSETQLAAERTQIEKDFDALLAKPVEHELCRRLRNFLIKHRLEILPYLHERVPEATNCRGEQAIRPAVVNRKINGGNRTPAGAHAQEILVSVHRTARQRKINPVDLVVRLLRATDPEEFARTALGPRPRQPRKRAHARRRLQARQERRAARARSP
jgi:transposase